MSKNLSPSILELGILIISLSFPHFYAQPPLPFISFPPKNTIANTGGSIDIRLLLES